MKKILFPVPVIAALLLFTGCSSVNLKTEEGMQQISALQYSDALVLFEEAEKEGMELLRKLGLASKADNYPFQLSGGQQQRAAIARALILRPKVLFFDEPTSALDPELTGEVLKVIRALAREHTTMVIVTHEMMFARDVSDRIIFMDNGVVVENSTPEELFASENPRTQAFLGKYLAPDQQ